MLSDLEKLMACRREREDRAAAALRQARSQLSHLEAAITDAEAKLEEHHRERKSRQDKLYRQSMKSRLSKYEIDGLNIELDLMAETTDALTAKVDQAKKALEQGRKAVDTAATAYRQKRHDSERWGHLVENVAATERRQAEQAEEFQMEDDQGDRRATLSDGFG